MAKSRRRLIGKLLATATAATLGLLGFVGAAVAAQPDGVPPSNAPEGAVGDLIIFKFAGTPITQENPNGTMLGPVARPPLAGVQFTICKVQGFNPLNPTDWQNAATLNPADATCDPGFVNRVVTTDGVGYAVARDLPMGLYKVMETDAPPGVSKSITFLVSIPYPSVSKVQGQDVTTWLWTVYTYPKNTYDSTGLKEIADPGTFGLGSDVQWTIKSRAIGSIAGGEITSYKLVDKLQTDKLVYKSSDSLKWFKPGDTVGLDVLSVYYDIVVTPGVPPGGQTIEAVFNEAGVGFLGNLTAGTYFQWKLSTTVTGIGNLENRAFDNDGVEDFELGRAITNWGPARLLKHEKNNEAKVLKGAKFEVYKVGANNDCAPLGDKVTVNGVTEFISDADGQVNIAGLYVGKNGVPTSRDYCVKETVAPSGYSISNADPVKITVTSAALTAGFYNAKVPNTPVEGPNLPLTGASGTVLMTVGGLALLALAGGVYLVSRRKQVRG